MDGMQDEYCMCVWFLIMHAYNEIHSEVKTQKKKWRQNLRTFNLKDFPTFIVCTTVFNADSKSPIEC